MAETYTQTETIASVKQLECTGCGNALSVKNPRTKYISCQYCGSVLDLNSEEYQILQQLPHPDKFPPYTFLKVGMVGTIKGKTYQIIARTRWKQDYYEYWEEEGERGYSPEIWFYDEWLLISEQRTYIYLVEDKENYYWSEEIIPNYPSIPEHTGQRWELMDKNQRAIIREMGAAEVQYFEGETNYNIKIGDRVKFASYKEGRDFYSAEWRLFDDNSIKEIEFFKETPIGQTELLDAFDEGNELLAERLEKGRQWGFIRNMALIAGLFSFILLFYSWIKPEQEIFRQEISSMEMDSDLNVSSLNDSIAIVTKPFHLEKGLHRFYLTGDFVGNNSDFFLLAYFKNEQGEIINSLDVTISKYSGSEYDSETGGFENWSEVNRKNSELAKVKEAGNYTAHLFAKGEVAMPSATIRITKGILLSRYFALGMFVFFVISLIAISKRKKYLR